VKKVPKLHYDHVAQSEVGYLFRMSQGALVELDHYRLCGGMGTAAFEAMRPLLGTAGSNMHHQMVTWERCGQHVYVVGPHVAQALSNTDLTGVTADMVEGDAPCFYVALRDSDWKIWGGPETRYHRLDGFYVTISLRKDVSGRLRPALSFMLWGQANERSTGPLDDACFWFSIPNDVAGDLEEVYGKGPAMPDDGGLDESRDDYLGSLLDGAPADVQAEQRQLCRTVYRLSINLLLYLDSQQPDVEDDTSAQDRRRELEDKASRAKSDGKRKKILRRLKALPTTRVRYVGLGIEDAMAAAEERRNVPTERQVGDRRSPRKHVVRPHWRHYWVGSGADRRKVRKWIALYERGSGDADRTVTIVRE